MATHISMVFDQRKKYTYNPNAKIPITGPSKISQTYQFSQEKQKNIRVNAQLKLVQEWRSKKIKNVGIKPSCPNDDDDEFLEVQPFVEEPVSFNFGDDYGNKLFRETQKELVHNWVPHMGRRIDVVDGMKFSDDDVYILFSDDDVYILSS